MTRVAVRRKDLVLPELSYEITGVLFDVFKEVGDGHKEKFYQKAVSIGLEAKGFKFEEQVPSKVYYQNQKIGLYYFDFLVENKIIIELKAKHNFSTKDIDQLYSYLKAHNLQLGLLCHFTRTGARVKRIVNID